FSLGVDGNHRRIHSFPTRRSSDLGKKVAEGAEVSILPRSSGKDFCRVKKSPILEVRGSACLPRIRRRIHFLFWNKMMDRNDRGCHPCAASEGFSGKNPR